MGLQYLFATLILAGLLQMAAGALRLGKFVRMITSSVMMGFVNGLAIVILRLRGRRRGQHSIRINQQYRICFRWEDGYAYEIEITDYH